jgi:hypothetical protein
MTDETTRPELAPYAGRWVALIRGRVAGVGWTSDEARRAARRNRPKEAPEEVIFVPVEDGFDDARGAA